MRNNLLKCLGILFLLSSCIDEAEVPSSQLTINFTHHWDGQEVTNADFNQIQFTNENGEELSIERLRYLISNIALVNTGNFADLFSGYQLLDLSNPNDLSITLPREVANGSYTLVFTFGFNNQDNQDGLYQELNSASWNVPALLGGGYHFMQLDGKFIDANTNTANYNYHTIQAVDDTDPNNLVFQNTFFIVELGSVIVSEDATIEVKMNIAEWFKNPNTWDLNALNTVLMPNFNAQLMMSENGKNVFSLGE